MTDWGRIFYQLGINVSGIGTVVAKAATGSCGIFA